MTLSHSLTPATKQSQKGCPKTTTASLGFGRSAQSNTRRLASSCFLTGVTIDDLIDGIEVTTRDDDTFEVLRCSYFETLIVFDRNCPPPEKKGKGGVNGEGGIRTHDALADMLVFKTRAINHSTTSPLLRLPLSNDIHYSA